MRLLLLVLALVLSPIGMAAGAGAAHAQTVEVAGHCAGMAMPADDHEPARKIDCMSVCSAVAPGQAAVPERTSVAPIVDESEPAPALIGSAPERETPPPRFS